MESIKLLPFYKLHDWMIEELGLSTDAALIAFIYSFQANGIECQVTYPTLAEILKVNRKMAFKRIKSLQSRGYITVTNPHTTKTNIYAVNLSAFPNSPQKATNTSVQKATNENITSVQKATNTSVQKATNTSVQKATNTSVQKATSTIIENNREIKEKERERTRSRNSQKEFTPPTVEDVAAYCAERQNEIDAHRFIDYYTANGWTQSKGTPIKDWKAVVRIWEQREKEKKAAQQTHSSINMQDVGKIFSQSSGSSIDMDDVYKLINQF